MLPRSKSAPKSLDDLTVRGGPDAARLTRSRTVQTTLNSLSVPTPFVTPWEMHNDPFSLTRFFPSRLTEQQAGWDWLHAHEPGLDIDEEEDEDVGDEDEDDEGDNKSSYGDLFESAVNKEEDFDALIRQLLDGEDKYGMLAFSSENIPSLLRFKMPVFERPVSPVHVSPLNVDEPIDLEGLHMRHCVRREDSIDSRKDEGLQEMGGIGNEIGELFFSDGESTGTRDGDGGIELPYWIKTLYGLAGASVGKDTLGAWIGYYRME
ncbi:hypothetical protein BU17DRAFT_100423 [Hysterangium stoloniferum]|nr:hypothetical protein BU17DRAFT_100423 [Hysterangium stoloniferum]